MKVTYEFDLDDEKRDDNKQLKIFQYSKDMYHALFDLSQAIRDLNKGYHYFDEDGKLKIDSLIDALVEILRSSKYYEME